MAYCNQCQRLVLINRRLHKHHELSREIDEDILRHPTRLLRSIQDNKGEAVCSYCCSKGGVLFDLEKRIFREQKT